MGFLTASLSILCMLTVTGFNDRVPILPASLVEWREVIEYTLSIVLAFGTGNILGVLIFQIFPGIMAHVIEESKKASRCACRDEQDPSPSGLTQDLSVGIAVKVLS